MSRFAVALPACVIAIMLASGTALAPAPAETAKMSKAELMLFKDAVKGCKAQAKAKNLKWFRWIARRKYINDCVIEALKEHPNIVQMIKYNPNLAIEEWDQPVEFKRE